MKKIFFVIGTMSNGGAERVVSILSNYFSKDYKVYVIALFDPQIDYILEKNVQYVFLLKDDKSLGLLRNINRIKKLRYLVKELKPECVISFLSIINMIAIVACLFTKTKLILSERNDPRHEPSTRILRFFRNILYLFRKNNYFVFQTQYAMNCFGKKIQAKSVVIFNPIQSGLPKHREDVIRKIVCVSRLTSDKNIPMLINAFSNVVKQHNEYVLEIYGRGELIDVLKNKVKKMDLNEKIFFRGFSANVHEKICNADLFVLPSNFEGISNAMLEAMAMGIPTICTDCPAYGAREFIQNGKNGFLINVGDEKDLTAKILTVIENSQLAKEISSNSVKIKTILNEKEICRQWMRFLDEKVFHEN